MGAKTWALLAGILAIAVIVFLVVRPKNDRSQYTEEQRAEVRTLVANADSNYARIDAVNLPVYEAYLSFVDHKQNLDSLGPLAQRAIESRKPVIAELRHQLDSLERLERDTTSQFTKGLALYIKATRHAMLEMESQAPAMSVLQDPEARRMPPPPMAPVTSMPPGGPEVDPATVPPMALPLAQSMSILKRLNQERAKAEAMMAGQ